jgi:hypothetical protein
MEDIFKGLGVEISLKTPDDFLKIKETLTRIGIASRKERKLFQSCHILHKQGRYRILHFKELFILDGKENNLTNEDIARRNTIANLLEEWNLIDIVDHSAADDPVASMDQLKVISFSDKNNWQLTPKYTIGGYHR